MCSSRVLLLLSLWAWLSPGGEAGTVWCAPRLWEGKKWSLQITHTDNGADIIESTADFSIDVIGQRRASDERGTHNGQDYHIKYLWYYPANTLYMVHDGVCEMHLLTGNFSQDCHELPDPNAVEFLNELLGPLVGPNTILTWGTRGLMPDNTGYFYSLVEPVYLPLIAERQGVIDGVPAYAATSYYNCTEGIQDPGVFAVPTECLSGHRL